MNNVVSFLAFKTKKQQEEIDSAIKEEPKSIISQSLSYEERMANAEKARAINNKNIVANILKKQKECS